MQLKVDLFVTRGFFNTNFAPPATELDEKNMEGMEVEGPSTGPCPMTPRTVAADLDQIMSENPMSTAVHIIPGRPKIDTMVPSFIQEARGRSLVVCESLCDYSLLLIAADALFSLSLSLWTNPDDGRCPLRGLEAHDDPPSPDGDGDVRVLECDICM